MGQLPSVLKASTTETKEADALSTTGSDGMQNSERATSDASESPASLASDFTELTVHSTAVSATTALKLKICETKICAVVHGRAPIRIELTVINESTNEVVRCAGIDFYAELKDSEGKPRTVQDAKLVTGSEHDSTDETLQKVDSHTLHFDYTNRVIYGVKNIPEDWPAQIKEELQRILAHPRTGHMKMKLPYDPKQYPQRIKNLLAYLNHSKPNMFYSPLKYNTSDKKSSTYPTSKFIETWDELGWAYGQAKKLGVAPGTSAVHCFGGPDEAKLRLVHGRYAEYLWEKKVVEDISSFTFTAAFVETRSGAVLAFLQKSEQRALPRISDTMALEVSFNGMGIRDGVRCMKTFRALGQLTINELAIDCTIVLLLRRVPKRMYEKATPYGDIKSGRVKAEFMAVDVRVKDYEQARLQVQSVNTFFNNQTYRRFWAGFMGVNSVGLQPKHFLIENLGLGQTQIDVVIARVRRIMAAEGMILNPEQDAILSNIGVSNGGWNLIRGPPGTGKSTLIAILACTLLLLSPDTCVLLVAPSNGASSKLFGSLVAVMATLGIIDPQCRPLRVFRKYYEMDHFYSYFDPDGSIHEGSLSRRTNEQVAEILEDQTEDWYSRQLDAEDRRVMDNAENGLMAAVIQAFENGKLCEYSPVRARTSSLTYAKQARQDMQFREAKEALAKLKIHQSAPKADKPKRLTRIDLQENAGKIATHVIRGRRAFVTTANNASTYNLREGIGGNFKSLSIFFDEQTLATDISTVSVVAGTINADRVDEEFGGISPVDMVTLVGDEKQGVPLVQSQQDNANLFGPQMELSTFERMVKVGMPVQTLPEQHRMVPLLRELPSERSYDDHLRDSVEVQARTLTSSERSILRKIVKSPVPDFETMPGGENQQLRHLLLDLPNTEEGKEEETASRLNMSNIEVTINLVRYLVLSGLVTPREIVILTFYNAQKKEYIRALSNLEKELGLKQGDFDDCVETCDSFQGRERKCVILDFVVTYFSKHTGMGNVSNERKVNVACTRARDYFFVVARLDILKSPNIRCGGRLEYALELLNRLKARTAFVDVEKVKVLAREMLLAKKAKKATVGA